MSAKIIFDRRRRPKKLVRQRWSGGESLRKSSALSQPQVCNQAAAEKAESWQLSGYEDARRQAKYTDIVVVVYIDRTRQSPFRQGIEPTRETPAAAGSATRNYFGESAANWLRQLLPRRIHEIWRFSLTKFGIQLFCVFRDKRVSRTQAAGVLPGSGSSRLWSD